MPGSVAPNVQRNLGLFVATGAPQVILHRVGRAPRFINIIIENIDMATPGQYTTTINSRDSSIIDVTVIPAGASFFVSVGR